MKTAATIDKKKTQTKLKKKKTKNVSGPNKPRGPKRKPFTPRPEKQSEKENGWGVLDG